VHTSPANLPPAQDIIPRLAAISRLAAGPRPGALPREHPPSLARRSPPPPGAGTAHPHGPAARKPGNPGAFRHRAHPRRPADLEAGLAPCRTRPAPMAAAMCAGAQGTCRVQRARCLRPRGRRGLPDCLMDSMASQARPPNPCGLDPAGIGSPRSQERARAHEPRPARRYCRCDDRSSAQSGADGNDGEYRRPGRPLVTCKSQGRSDDRRSGQGGGLHAPTAMGRPVPRRLSCSQPGNTGKGLPSLEGWAARYRREGDHHA